MSYLRICEQLHIHHNLNLYNNLRFYLSATRSSKKGNEWVHPIARSDREAPRDGMHVGSAACIHARGCQFRA